MLTPAILGLMISNILVASAAFMATCHTSFLLSDLTNTGRPIEKEQTESNIPSKNYSQQEVELLSAA